MWTTMSPQSQWLERTHRTRIQSVADLPARFNSVKTTLAIPANDQNLGTRLKAASWGVNVMFWC